MCVEIRQRPRWFHSIRVRIVGIPYDVFAVQKVRDVLERRFVAIASHRALPLEILARQHRQMLRFSHYAVATVRVDIHTTEPKGCPAGIGFKDRQPELGKAL